ncbi:MAG: hypothetical protein AAGC44_03485 [Planctomycetota bacterium]
MKDLIERLAQMITRNGYEVAFHQDEGGFIFDIVHQPTQRQAVYAFNRSSLDAAVRAMARQYCTDEQLNELAESGVNLIEVHAAC